MIYRTLGKTGLSVSEIGFGGEWLERHDNAHGVALMRYAAERGVNIVDCWMPDPKSRDIIGAAMQGNRENWIVQGHLGSTWQNGQYVRTRDMKFVKPAFEDQLQRMMTDYIDLGMIHYVDSVDEWNSILHSPYMDYVFSLKERGVIRHIGLSTHNPRVGMAAVNSGIVEMILFSINPAFDMHPATEDLDDMMTGEYAGEFSGIDQERARLYQLCEEKNIGITVMKGFFGGRLFDAKTSPFGVAFTPCELIHYALTRPGVSSILCGFDDQGQVDDALHYLDATEEEKNYARVLASAPLHSYQGQCTYCGHCKPCPKDIDIAMANKLYDLAVMQPEVPQSVREHYRALPHTAEECIACHACETRCPFGVKVADRMRAMAELFKA